MSMMSRRRQVRWKAVSDRKGACRFQLLGDRGFRYQFTAFTAAKIPAAVVDPDDTQAEEVYVQSVVSK